MNLQPPIQETEEYLPTESEGPKLISTLNSNRLAQVLGNDGIQVLNKPVLELVAKPEHWPESFIEASTPRSEWPYLVLTSPFAARCAIEVSQTNEDLNRIQWLAIGEGTARACFKRGVTVSMCGKARNSVELAAYIDKMVSRNIKLMVPRSNVGSNDFITSLTSLGFEVDSWVGYENKAKEVTGLEMGSNDVLLLSSPSSAKAWMKNSLPIPKNILCMGKTSREEIASMDYFAGSTVEVLKGPTAKFVAKWWKNYEVEL
jgi:uroporphyrinogen-III synthase